MFMPYRPLGKVWSAMLVALFLFLEPMNVEFQDLYFFIVSCTVKPDAASYPSHTIDSIDMGMENPSAESAMVIWQSNNCRNTIWGGDVIHSRHSHLCMSGAMRCLRATDISSQGRVYCPVRSCQKLLILKTWYSSLLHELFTYLPKLSRQNGLL